jgi:hypothetical protein
LKLTVPQLLEKSFRVSDIPTATPSKKWLTSSAKQYPETLDYFISAVLQSCRVQITALISLLFQQQNSAFLIVTLIFWSVVQFWIPL